MTQADQRHPTRRGPQYPDLVGDINSLVDPAHDAADPGVVRGSLPQLQRFLEVGHRLDQHDPVGKAELRFEIGDLKDLCNGGSSSVHGCGRSAGSHTCTCVDHRSTVACDEVARRNLIQSE